jgi:C4-dicarboxylate-specific signal transduction histidine kinase
MIRNAVQLAVCAAALAAAACSGQEAAVETAANAVAHAESASHDSAKDHSAAEAKRQSGHDTHSYVMPDISEMTGSIKLVNAKTGGTFTEQDLLGALEKTAKQAQRAGQIIQRIRSFVKRSEPNRTLAEVAVMVDEALELAEIELRRRNVRLTHYVAPRLAPLLVDPILIEQVLLNLLKNAAESVDAAQRPSAQRNVKLRVAPQRVNERAVIEFSVTDSGRGLTPEVSARLYEAFYSTKADGMGIGLSLCRSIVESHLGRMKAENLYNGVEATGCVFSFWLPCVQTETPASTDPQLTAKDVH